MTRTQEEMNQYIEYEKRIFDLKIYAYQIGLSITINSNDGFFMIYDESELSLLIELGTFEETMTYLVNYERNVITL